MSKIEKLIEKGVKIDRPASVEIGDEVDVDRISGDGVVIYAGCKIFGADTLILTGSKLGYEAPVTVDNCQVGPEVELKGGYFKQAVFLAKSQAGSGVSCPGGDHSRRTGRHCPHRSAETYHSFSVCHPGQSDQFL